MSSYLFIGWIPHFINVLGKRQRISPENRHILVLDGHKSHVTLDVVMAKERGLDMLTLPNNTSHCLQPLNLSIFNILKQQFEGTKMHGHYVLEENQQAKRTLYNGFFLRFIKTFSPANIIKCFQTTSIWLLISTPWINTLVLHKAL